jgi:alpha-glucosidase
MSKKRIFLQLALLLLPLMMSAQTTQKLTSPDGNYVFHFEQSGGGLYYDLSFRGKEVIRRSELGVDIDNRLFESALGIPNDTCRVWTENLQFRGIDRTSRDSVWHPLYGENASIRDRYNEMVIHFCKGGEGSVDKDAFDKRRQYFFDIVVRAYDEGVALRYHFPETTNGLFLNITGEYTSFAMPAGTMAYYEEWAQGPFHYQPLKDWRAESERPLFMRLPSGLSVALLEASMTDYARGKFRLAAPDKLQISMYDGVELMSPYSTPWRVIMAGERPVDLINHKDLILNLNPACKISDTSFIRPGKAFRCGRLERNYIMQGIDFAQRMNLQYIELDARWYGPEMAMSSSALSPSPDRNFTIPELCDSARHHGIGVWLYVNQRALYQQLDSILPLYHRWGVSGIKFGFVQVGNQMWSTWLHRAVAKCAEYGLMVDIHDEYRPSGFSRTYPNLMSQEGVRGNEEMPDADHNTILPFTRYLCGPADYTLSYYCGRIKNTRAHQLAMAAVYYSPVQFMFWYDDPKVFDGGAELKFWSRIPTVFDESRALDGAPGEYIIQARCSGTTWFVGAMTNREARTVTLRTADFLPRGKYTVDVFTDDPSLKTRSRVASNVITVKSGKVITLPLQPSGGAALIFTPMK